MFYFIKKIDFFFKKYFKKFEIILFIDFLTVKSVLQRISKDNIRRIFFFLIGRMKQHFG